VEEILALASLNTFGMAPKADIVPHSEESVFILTSGQLQDIIKEAIQPAQDEIESLKATITNLTEKVTAMEATQDTLTENQLIQLRLISQLRNETVHKPQPKQRDMGDLLRLVLADCGGKCLAKDARRRLHMSKERFSKLLDVCDFVETKPYHLDRRQLVIILKG
jgi:hypothetical protein